VILGIGTDMTSIERIRETLAEHGERFVSRCFAPVESARVEDKAKGNEALRAAGYAKRWAAKEACAKALGCGIRDEVFLKDIIVVNDEAGKPSLQLQGGAAVRLSELTPPGKKASVHVSLSDDGGNALAFVVISVS
jgi:holo-[acyl-carrier protein] synthase